MQQIWTKKEEELLLELRTKYTVKETAAILHRSKASVKRKADRLNIKFIEDGRRKWAKEEEYFISEHYNVMSVKEIARTLRRSHDSVQRKAQTMGLTKRAEDGRKAWTKEEELYMHRRYMYQPLEKTASVLKRTPASVKRKAAALGLSTYGGELINAKMLGECFGLSVSVIIRWVNKFGLPAKQVVYPHQTRYLIDMEDFWPWAEKNKEKINWSGYIRDSVPPEPQWVADAIKNDSTNRHGRPITTIEKSRIRDLMRQGLSYREISNITGRSRDSVKHIGRKLWLPTAL